MKKQIRMAGLSALALAVALPALRPGLAAAGPKGSVLTAGALSELFDAPIAIEESDGYYYARPGVKR